jgi:hypothetical protein
MVDFKFIVVRNKLQSNLSKTNPFGTEKFVQFRQVVGLHRDRFRHVSLYMIYDLVKSYMFFRFKYLIKIA